MNRESISNKQFSLRDSILAVFLSTAFGANAIAIKFAFAGLGAFTTAALRFSIAAVIIFVWARSTGRKVTLKSGQYRQVLLLGLIFAIQLSLIYKGLSYTEASRAVLIINLHPFFLLFLAHYFIPGDRFTLQKLFGLILGLAGLAIVFLDKGATSSQLRYGDLMVLGATAIWAFVTVYLKRIIHTFEAYQIVLYQMIISSPIFLLEGFLFDGNMFIAFNWKVAGAMLYQSVVTASFGFIAWSTLLQKYGAVSLHSFLFIQPVAGVLISSMLLGEILTINILMALLLIAVGIIIVNLRSKIPFYPLRRSGI